MTQTTKADVKLAMRVGWQLARREPVAYGIAVVVWITWYTLPAAAAVALKWVLDRVEPSNGNTVWLALAAFAGLELGRWVLFVFNVVQWHGLWVFWHALPQLNIFTSLFDDPGPVEGRLPGSSGEAVSRFRDDARYLGEMLDTWLDTAGAVAAATFALVAMAAVDLRLTVLVSVPLLAATWLSAWLGQHLRRWREREREATAAVTSFIGETFGAVATIKLAGARPAALRRFNALGETRASAARTDQVGTQALETTTAAVGDIATALVILLMVPSLASGAATVGDVGLFTATAMTLAGLPRWVARNGAHTHQAAVSVQRLRRMMPERKQGQLTAPVDTMLREGPGRYAPVHTAPRGPQVEGAVELADPPEDELKRLDIQGLSVAHAGLKDLDLTLDRGTLTVVTGLVGSGKSTLLRALLGLMQPDAGEILWNGHPVNPAEHMISPRVAYVPQVPRLFSEPLSDAILLGERPDHVDAAVRLVCLDDEVSWMPEGMATVVGARGVRLSGGQIQRVATARALVRRPELLVIDDLSSALDVETEAHLWRGLVEDSSDGDEAGRIGASALLVVTHRPTVLDYADQVIEL